MSVHDVLSGAAPHHVECAEAVAFLDSLPADCADLLFCSPPYVAQRTYQEGGVDPGVARGCDEWVAWMLGVCAAARRVCRGLCAFVAEGATEDFRYDAAPFLLLADLKRAGYALRKPPAFRRVGVPGSGGSDWLRNDYEPVVCFTRGGRLPWSDPTACGRPPKYGPGGAMSNRTKDGARVDRRKGGATRGKRRGDAVNGDAYVAPDLANPGNVIRQESYTADEVALLLERAGAGASEVVDCVVGGGRMGSKLAHRNEAPFPESLAAFFVRTFCPPGGVVLDCFSGSGTTAAVAHRHGRRALACDLRPSQVELSRRRLAAETPDLFERPAAPARANTQSSLFGGPP